jgi:hypothetical protein
MAPLNSVDITKLQKQVDDWTEKLNEDFTVETLEPGTTYKVYVTNNPNGKYVIVKFAPDSNEITVWSTATDDIVAAPSVEKPSMTAIFGPEITKTRVFYPKNFTDSKIDSYQTGLIKPVGDMGIAKAAIQNPDPYSRYVSTGSNLDTNVSALIRWQRRTEADALPAVKEKDVIVIEAAKDYMLLLASLTSKITGPLIASTSR